MTTRTVTILPNTPTSVGERGIEYGMHNGWTMEVTNKSATYLTDDYPAKVITGPASLIAQQSGWASSTYTVTGGSVREGTIPDLWFQGASYAVVNLNGVEYKLKFGASVTTPTQVKTILQAGGYVVA